MNKQISRIDYSNVFLKQLKKAPLEIKKTFKNRLVLFLKDEFYPILRNHQLTGTLKSYRSINITGDWRALYSEYTHGSKRVIVFEMFGTHVSYID